MAATRYQELTITRLLKLSSTSHANPRWEVTFGEDDPVLTSSDVNDAYDIGRPGLRVGDTVHVSFTRAGRIARIHSPADRRCRCGETGEEG